MPEASRRMSDADQQTLYKQAYEQAGNFEVLNKADVASMSRVSFAPVAFLRTYVDIVLGTSST